MKEQNCAQSFMRQTAIAAFHKLEGNDIDLEWQGLAGQLQTWVE